MIGGGVAQANVPVVHMNSRKVPLKLSRHVSICNTIVKSSKLRWP